MFPDEQHGDERTAPKTLRAFLVGTWQLESYFDVAEDGSVSSEPLGGRAEGQLIYAGDGFMSVQMMRADRQPFASGDWFSPSPPELNEAARFIGYAGRYSVDEAAQLVTHHIAVSFFPNWIGQAQSRRVEQAEGRLILTAAAPIRSGGKTVTPRITWQRALSP